nr:putative nucleotidyltransferase, ribonuclease H [Tanacetum cinerariifolium]
MLYGRKCRAPICWDHVVERVIERPEMIEVTNEKVAVAKEKLKEARTRQKSYADKHRRSIEFQPGDRVFLKVSPARGVRHFGIKDRLSPRFIGPFEILDRVGEDYALETATCILNMVPTKKVDKTPYELWYRKVPNLSYLKVWGREVLVKRDTLDKLQQRSVKCIFIGYLKETIGYYFYFLPKNKIVVVRYAKILEKNVLS